MSNRQKVLASTFTAIKGTRIKFKRKISTGLKVKGKTNSIQTGENSSNVDPLYC